MAGQYMVHLGEQIIAARAEANETRTIQGSTHPSTIAADQKLRSLMQEARQLFH